MSIFLGGLAPRFSGATQSNPRFSPGAFGGRYIVLFFLPTDDWPRQSALSYLGANRELFDDVSFTAYGVLRDEKAISMARDRTGLRWFLDRDSSISRLFDAVDKDGTEHPRWVLLDPAECILQIVPIEYAANFFAYLKTLPAPDAHAGVPVHAPVLIAPRILSPELCKALIAYYDRDGGTASGVMREIDGKTVPVLDDYKRRRDADITDMDLVRDIHISMRHRLLPQIKKVFQFQVTRIERNIVACYDAADGGYFMAHRDDTTKGTAHRKFACSINLNAEDFEGGDLRFPEFGQQTYRPPTGGAVIFSCSLLHEATSVTRGTRYAYLPFFYDEKAAEIRAQNAGSLELPVS